MKGFKGAIALGGAAAHRINSGGFSYALALSLILIPVEGSKDAFAQTYHDTGGTILSGFVPVEPGAGPLFTLGNPGQVAGTFSASLGGFTPSVSGARMTPLAVSASDSSQTLPTGAVVVVSNVGASNPMYCNVNGVAATTSDQEIQGSSWFAFTIPTGVTTLHCIATGGSTTANGVGGSGLPTGAGGGGSGSSVATGSAGSPNAAVVTVQGIGGGTGVPVTGTFWQAMQPVSLTSLPALGTGANTIGAVTQASGPWTINQTQINGSTVSTAASGVQKVGVVGSAGATLDSAAGSSATQAIGIQGVTGGVAVPVSGTFWQATQPVSLASLPAGAATIGAVTQASGPWTSNITQFGGSAVVTGTGVGGSGIPRVTVSSDSSLAASQSGTWNITNVSGTVSLPTGAATAANQTNASQKTQIVDGSGNVIASTSNNLNVQCANCSGSGVSTGDNAAWTFGTSPFAGTGGVYQTSPASNPLTAGRQGFAQLTQYRALMTDWYNSSGVEMGTSGAPVRVDPTGATTQPISAASLPLPSGAATAANQATANTSLVTLHTDLSTLNTTAGAPVVMPLNQGLTDCSVTLTTGGTAQNAFAAQTTLHGFTIANIDASAGSGEPVWFSFTGTAVAGAAGSYPLAAPTATTFAGLTSFTSPPGMGSNHALSVIAATTGHKISCTWW